jgi:3-phenylpropionate/trans-cinnamate dioxygenase ferredoxin subunit
MGRLVPVAKVTELPPGQMKWVLAEHERLLLANVGGTFYALADECGHQSVPLSRGALQDYRVECSLHFAQYDVRTGELISGPPSDDIFTYAVRIKGDTVYVEI